MPVRPRFRALPLLPVIALSMLAGCRASVWLSDGISTEQRTWPQAGGGPDRRQTASHNLVPPLIQRWSHATEGAQAHGSPLCGTRHALVHSVTGAMEFVDVATGLRSGVVPFAGVMHTSPVLTDSLLLAALMRGDPPSAALHLSSHSPAWRSQRRVLVTDILVHDSLLVTVDRNGMLLAGPVRDSAIIWSVSLPGRTGGVLAAKDTLLMVADRAGDVQAFSVRTGASSWRTPCGSPITRAPVCLNDRVIVVTRDGSVRALALDDGRELWNVPCGHAVHAGPAADDSVVCVASSDGRIRLLSSESGGVRWTVATGALISAAPLLTPGFVYVAGRDGSLRALDRTDGAVRWTDTLPAGVRKDLAVCGHHLLVCTDDGYVHGYSQQESVP